MRRSIATLVLVATLVGSASPAHAVILYGKRLRNMSAPAGSLANSGWQWEGEWNDFLGTAISKNTFITAGHVGGNVGDLFTLNGVSYHTVASWNDPQSDLQIWAVHGRFASWAPLQTTFTEPNAQAMMFGRGTQRGPTVTVGGVTKGWLWGADDHVESWGMNTVLGSSTASADNGAHVRGGLLYWSFDRSGLSQEGILSGGDSGGGVFVKNGNTWDLAGINYSVQATFSYPSSSAVQNGAIFDFGGLTVGGKSITDQSDDVAALSFATRISTRASWINDVLTGKISTSASLAVPGTASTPVPEPSVIGLVYAACAALLVRSRPRG